MATFTSKATGNWSASGQTTWNEAGVPGAGDTVTITANHVITVDVDTIVGASNGNYSAGVTPGAIEWTGTTGTPGKLIIAAGKKLTARGDLVNRFNVATANANVILQLEAGATLEFDSSADGAGIGYRFGSTTNSYRSTKILCNGTSGARSKVQTISSLSGDSTKWGRLTSIGSEASRQDGLSVEATYTDFIRLGTPTVDSIFVYLNVTSAGFLHLKLNHCRFQSCYGWRVNNLADGCSVDVQNTYEDKDCLSPSVINVNTARTSGTRLVKNSLFWQRFGRSGGGYNTQIRDFQIEDCVFLDNVTINGATAWASTSAATHFKRCLVVMRASQSTWYLLAGLTLENIYGFADLSWANSKFITCTNTHDMSIDGYVVDGGNWWQGDQPDTTYMTNANPAAERTYTLRRILTVPNARGYAPGVAGNLGFNAATPLFNFSVEHCTIALRETQGGIDAMAAWSGGESGIMKAGQVTSFQSNLFFSLNGSTKCGKFVDVRQYVSAPGDSPTDIIDPANADYNAMYDGQAIGDGTHASYWEATPGGNKNGYFARFSADPGTHDIDVLHPAWTGPAFKDRYRCLPRFDIGYLGHAVETAWQSGQAYSVGDEVSVTWPDLYGGLPINFRCIAAHTSSDYYKPNSQTCLSNTTPGTHIQITNNSALSLTAQVNAGILGIVNKEGTFPNTNYTFPASSVVYLYAVIAASDADGVITSFSLTHNLTGIPPANSYYVAQVTTDGTGITAVANNATSSAGAGREAPFRTYWMPRSLFAIAEGMEAGSTVTDATLGLTNGTYIDALYAWVRDGYAPTNTLLQNAAHDGGDIGAVDWQAAESESTPRRRMLGRLLL